jgi:Flp pilus assembly protein TadD
MASANPSLISPPNRRPLGLVEPGGGPGWLAGALVLLCLIAYLPTLHNGFVWDDDVFLTKNALIQAPDGLCRFWFSTQPSDYWPVTSTTLWLEWRLWGLHAAGYHATNVALHLAEALLLWSILRRLRVPGAYLAALLFVVHPVNVESVAWIAQRKNLMAMLFYLLSIHCFLRTRWSDPTPGRWLDSAAGPAPRSRVAPPSDLVAPPSDLVASPNDLIALPSDLPMYGLSLLAFIFALLSKGSVAPLPVVFLGIIAWRRRVVGRDVLKLTPFFLVAAALIGVNVWFQTHGSGEIVRHADGLERLLGAGAVVWFYLTKALLPVGLVFVYPQWNVSTDNLLWWLPLLAAAALTGLLWARVRSLSPVIPSAARNPVRCGWRIPRSARNDRISRHEIWRSAWFAWLYFVVMLLPVMGFTDVYFMQFSLVADHYQHLAIIGVLALAAAAWTQLGIDSRVKFVVAAGVVGLLAMATYREAGTFRDDPALWTATVQRNPGSSMAQNNLGMALFLQGRIAEAASRFERALAINPANAEAHYNRGLVLAREGRRGEAMAEDATAVRLRPAFPDAQNNLGKGLLHTGRPADAIPVFERALRLEPDNAETHANLGAALIATGHPREAVGELERALQLKPDYAETCNNLGVALAGAQRLPEAIVQYERALALKPDYFEADINLGNALANSGRLADAAARFQDALRLNPNYAPAAQNLARLRAKLQSSP